MHPNKNQPNTLYLLAGFVINYFRKGRIMETPNVPPHLLASEGRIYPQSDKVTRNYTPKQIDYRHTIRIITPFTCSHEEEMERMRTEKETLLRERDGQIARLTQLLRQKNAQMAKKDEELEQLRGIRRQNGHNFLKVSFLDNKLQRSQVTDIFHSNVKSHFDPTSFSNVKTSYIFDVASIDQQSSKEVANMEEELQIMEDNLKSLSRTLTKPARPYQFVTRTKQNRVITLPAKIERLQTAINVQDSHLVELQNCQAEVFNQEDQDGSVECTSTNQSFDATDFLQQAIHDHKILRDTLVELERSTKAEMEQMKQFYEDQIEGYKRMLQIQRDKCKQMDAIRMKREFERQFQVTQEEFRHILGKGNGNFENIKSLLDND